MRKVFVITVALLCGAAAVAPAADPGKILVCYGILGAYGSYFVPTIKTTFPGSTVTSFPDNQISAFVTALKTGGPWDMALYATNNYRSNRTSDYQAMADYYNKKRGPFFFNDWGIHYAYENPIKTAMGVSCTYRLTMPPKPHFTWVSTHPLVKGITNWTYGNAGVGTAGHPLTWTTATPVTGWTPTSTAGQGGICYATDKHSVFSGYKIHCILDSPQKLYTNILNYMWDGYNVGVEPASLGKVKAMYR